MKRFIIVSAIFSCLLVAFSLVSCSSFNSSPKELTSIKNAYKDYLLENTDTSKIMSKSIEEIQSNLIAKEICGETTYYFKDIDYSKDNNRSNWPAGGHVSNTLNYLLVAEKNNNTELKNIAIGLTYYWIYNNFRNTNWWNNDLGASNNLSNIALFIYDDLSDKGKAALKGKIHDASFKYHHGVKTHTGANLIDYADITMKSAIIDNDIEQFNEMFNRVSDEVAYKGVEGFQPDGSFFQHGKQIQIASYGKCIVRLGRLLKIVSTAGKQLSDDKMQIINDYLLKGLRCSVNKGYINYAALGREYSRVDSLDVKNLDYKNFKNYLDVPNFPDKENLKKFIDNLDSKQSTFDGIAYFDIAKLITMNIDGVYMSYKGSDNTLTNTECVNDENQLGLNLSYGTNTTVMDDGKEYYNISPLWRYDYLPGTTSIDLDDGKEDSQIVHIAQSKEFYNDPLYEKTLPEEDNDGNYVYGGGYNDKSNIACLMEKSNHHDENKFTVTCFACDDGMVLVGSNLEYTGQITGPGKYFESDRTMHTTIEQSKYKGIHQLSNDKKELVHGNVVYKILDNNNKIDVLCGNTTGKWQRNNPSLSKPVEPISDNMLLATINYDSCKGKSYAYSIQPKSKKDKEIVLIDTKDNDIHAIKLSNGKICAAFYKDGSFEFDGKTIEGKKGEFKTID